MSGKYIFYDLETTGRGKKETPDAFNATPKWNKYCKLLPLLLIKILHQRIKI